MKEMIDLTTTFPPIANSVMAKSLAEFFADDQVTTQDRFQAGSQIDGNRQWGEPKNQPPQMSATAYFNRQASLLMLYFPLAVSQ